jgi:hypothetical protein
MFDTQLPHHKRLQLRVVRSYLNGFGPLLFCTCYAQSACPRVQTHDVVNAPRLTSYYRKVLLDVVSAFIFHVGFFPIVSCPLRLCIISSLHGNRRSDFFGGPAAKNVNLFVPSDTIINVVSLQHGFSADRRLTVVSVSSVNGTFLFTRAASCKPVSC